MDINVSNPALTVMQQGNIPAQWVSPEVAEAAEREIHRQAILAEQEQAANAAVENEIDKRIAERHGALVAAGVHPLTENEVNNG